ncbi:maleylpyruvate isomerase family mycothiol-dependent enzyme [Streptomyces sp. NPDC000410]|uniref:maleylpyruvate isomerase family mycothiol-dependent enzyme n=1 Tax=Streptomyces sp. NPDC000410 TaxID=3154254 RepID=UPI0033246D8E
MIDPVRDLASVREATDRLIAAAAGLDNAAALEPSRLPDWSRGHILAHVALNADALANVLQGRPMYVSGEARDADIERDAPRPLAAHLDEARASAARFQAAAAEGGEDADWSRVVELRNGVKDAAARVPFRRLIEVELHHVDLGIGYELEDLPEEFTQREIAFLTERFTGNAALPPITVADTAGHTWSTGGEEGTPVTVSGAAPDLVGWLAGRRDGSALDVRGGSLPVLPPL